MGLEIVVVLLTRQGWFEWPSMTSGLLVKTKRSRIALAALCLVTVLLLRFQGRVWTCACGSWAPWAGDTNSMHNSQHLFDPYSFTHILHGILFYGALAWAIPRVVTEWKFVLALVIEAAWEVVENSPFIINRYREATFALGYEGDSILNSMGDLVSCALGFWIARRLGLRWSLVVFVAIELALLFWIRDNLTLNVIMLIYPVDAIKAWQLAT